MRLEDPPVKNVIEPAIEYALDNAGHWCRYEDRNETDDLTKRRAERLRQRFQAYRLPTGATIDVTVRKLPDRLQSSRPDGETVYGLWLKITTKGNP